MTDPAAQPREEPATHVHVVPLGYGDHEADDDETYSLVQCRECHRMVAVAPGRLALAAAHATERPVYRTGITEPVGWRTADGMIHPESATERPDPSPDGRIHGEAQCAWGAPCNCPPAATERPDPDHDDAECGCGAIGVGKHTNAEHYGAATERPRTEPLDVLAALIEAHEPVVEGGNIVECRCGWWSATESWSHHVAVTVESSGPPAATQEGR